MGLIRPHAVFHIWLERQSEEKLSKLGIWIAYNRKKTIFVCLLFCALCCIGFLNIRVEDDGVDLWVPTESKSRTDYTRIQESFGNFNHDASALFVSSTDENILTLANMEEIWNTYEGIVSLSAGEGKDFLDVCAQDGTGDCDIKGILKFWSNDRATYDAEVTSEAELLLALSVVAFPDGSAISRDLEFGNVIEDATTGSIISASAVRLNFQLAGNGKSDSWEAKYLSFMESNGSSLNGIDSYYSASRSIDDELARSITGEFMLFVITYLLMLVFAMMTLGKCDTVKARSSLAFGTMCWICISGAAAYGFCAGVGVPFTSLQQILPFLLIGIGLDDAFIITLAFDDTNPDLPTADRIGAAFGRCGLSVCFTSLVNFILFMLGAISTLPAIEYFCLYAGVAVLFDILIQVPSFLVMLAWDTDRQKAKKYDNLCYFCSPNQAISESADTGLNSRQHSGINNAQVVRLEPGTTSATTRIFKNVYLRMLFSKPGQVFAALLSMGLFAVSLWGILKVDQGLDIVSLVPDSSYAREYIEVSRSFDMYEGDDAATLFLVYEDIDLTDTAVQSEVLNLQEKVLENSYVTEPLYSWFSDFLLWSEDSTVYNGAIDTDGLFSAPELFFTAVQDFLLDPSYARYSTEIVFESDNSISVSRVSMYCTNLGTTEDSKSALIEVRDIVESSFFGDSVYAFSGFYISTEGDLVLEAQVYTNFLYGLVVVFIFSVVIIGHIRFAALVCALIAVVDAEVMATIFFWGLKLNTVTAIQLIMAAGLITDLIVHIVHYYAGNETDNSKSRKDRVLLASAEIGPSVLFAGLTTFVGILPMAIAQNSIFRTFFRMLFSILSLGMIAGLVTLPILLLIIPERSPRKEASHVQEMPSIAPGATVN